MDGTGEDRAAAGKIEEVIEFIFLRFTTQKHSQEVAITAILSFMTQYCSVSQAKEVAELQKRQFYDLFSTELGCET